MTEIEVVEGSVILLTIHKESSICHHPQHEGISSNTPITEAYIWVTQSAALVVSGWHMRTDLLNLHSNHSLYSSPDFNDCHASTSSPALISDTRSWQLIQTKGICLTPKAGQRVSALKSKSNLQFKNKFWQCSINYILHTMRITLLLP